MTCQPEHVEDKFSSREPNELKIKSPRHDKPLVTIIVPTFNSAPTLEACLASLRSQTYENVEIVVVDNSSSDGTRTIAESLAEKVLELGPERSSQVNAGARCSDGDYIYYVGADFVFDRQLVGEAVAAAEERQLDAILIHNRSDPRVGFWAKVREFERDMYRGDANNVAARFVRRSVFFALGGFDENLIAGEDYDFQRRLVAYGARIGWIDSSETHLGEPHSIKEVIAKHYFYGSSARDFVRKHGRSGFIQMSPLRRAFLVNWRRFLRHPVRGIELVVYLLVKYTAGALGFLFGARSARGS